MFKTTLQKNFKRRFSIQIIKDCRTIPSISFKTRLGFNNQDPIMTQEQSVLTKIKEAFSTEELIFRHCVLGYRIDAYFPKHKPAIEVDEKGHQDRDLECEIERQKALEKELNCKFIRINPARGSFNIFNDVCKIHHYIVKSREKSLLKRISGRLLSLEPKSDNTIKTNV